MAKERSKNPCDFFWFRRDGDELTVSVHGFALSGQLELDEDRRQSALRLVLDNWSRIRRFLDEGGRPSALKRALIEAACVASVTEGLTQHPAVPCVSDWVEAHVFEVPLHVYMEEAPFCSVCGHNTVRNGACFKCLNCGNEMCTQS